MTYLINVLALPILLSLVLGVIVGWLTYGRAETGTQASWLPSGLFVFALGVYAATAHLLPGREGFWLETGLVLFAGYLVGCTVGSGLRHLRSGAGLDGNSGLAVAGPANALIAAGPVPPTIQTRLDDLTLIWGVGEKLARTLNGMGVVRFEQIAAWSDDDILKFEGHSPEFRGRVARDHWIDQCHRLASGWRPENAVGERQVFRD